MQLIPLKNFNIKTCFRLKCWLKGQIISRIHLSLPNAYKLMCFDRNINGNRDVKILECDYLSVQWYVKLTLVFWRLESQSNLCFLLHTTRSRVQLKSIISPKKAIQNTCQLFLVNWFLLLFSTKCQHSKVLEHAYIRVPMIPILFWVSIFA